MPPRLGPPAMPRAASAPATACGDERAPSAVAVSSGCNAGRVLQHLHRQGALVKPYFSAYGSRNTRGDHPEEAIAESREIIEGRGTLITRDDTRRPPRP